MIGYKLSQRRKGCQQLRRRRFSLVCGTFYLPNFPGLLVHMFHSESSPERTTSSMCAQWRTALLLFGKHQFPAEYDGFYFYLFPPSLPGYYGRVVRVHGGADQENAAAAATLERVELQLHFVDAAASLQSNICQ